MKIVLSRKGFDSSSGLKKPSPILPPDDSLLSLPIPRRYDSGYSYDDLHFKGRRLGSIIRELNGRLPDIDIPHVDPDLDYERLPRLPGWKPIFGQHEKDQSHLENQDVGKGDLFLFYGWFHRTEIAFGKLRYCKPLDIDNVHVIYGWLQVGQVVQINEETVTELPDWVLYHPHVVNKNNYDKSNNTIYIATENLVLGGVKMPLGGGGVFPRFNPSLQLTWPALSRSNWRLPKWFFHAESRRRLSRHVKKPNRWQIKDNHVLLESVCLG